MLTFRRVIPLCVWLIVGVYFGERYSLDEFLHLLAWSFAIVILATFAFYFIHPSYILDPGHDVAWRGVCLHKNIFGPYMVLSTLGFRDMCAQNPSLRELLVLYCIGASGSPVTFGYCLGSRFDCSAFNPTVGDSQAADASACAHRRCPCRCFEPSCGMAPSAGAQSLGARRIAHGKNGPLDGSYDCHQPATFVGVRLWMPFGRA